MTKDEHYEALKKFFEIAVNGMWNGHGMDGFDIQDKAEELGLIYESYEVDEDDQRLFKMTEVKP